MCKYDIFRKKRLLWSLNSRGKAESNYLLLCLYTARCRLLYSQSILTVMRKNSQRREKKYSCLWEYFLIALRNFSHAFENNCALVILKMIPLLSGNEVTERRLNDILSSHRFWDLFFIIPLGKEKWIMAEGFYYSFLYRKWMDFSIFVSYISRRKWNKKILTYANISWLHGSGILKMRSVR